MGSPPEDRVRIMAISGAALPLFLLVQAQHCHKRFLWDFDVADHLEAFLALLLFFEQFLLARNVAAVAFGEYVLALRFDIRTADDLLPDGSLDRHREQLSGDQFL